MSLGSSYDSISTASTREVAQVEEERGVQPMSQSISSPSEVYCRTYIGLLSLGIDYIYTLTRDCVPSVFKRVRVVLINTFSLCCRRL